MRDRKGETTTMELDAFIAKVIAEIRNRSLAGINDKCPEVTRGVPGGQQTPLPCAQERGLSLVTRTKKEKEKRRTIYLSRRAAGLCRAARAAAAAGTTCGLHVLRERRGLPRRCGS